MARVTGIKTTYIICENGDTTTTTLQNFDASNDDVSEVRVGLPIGVEPVKPQPGDEGYSGMHDQGPLPEPKEGGPVAFLIGCVKAAKEHSDEFLTKCIEEEKKKKTQGEQQQSSEEIIRTTTPVDSPGTVAKKSAELPNKRSKQ
ncbi:unnamed protein product [Pseudo-nitzschia multistriata]|uniref:Uncharacterized protein n=1 Tax=Pseudo-nitzschia multistriata TaxID=183589 RepID=A0A448Z4T9_9STRA|nr:unnamed protein product [Pseudo-nitzschia multistriata]